MAGKATAKPTEEAVADHWKGSLAYPKSLKHEYRMLRWLAGAASKDVTRFFMTGIFNEVVGDKRVFVATDGHQMHKVSYPTSRLLFDSVPVDKNLAFSASSQLFVFTQEIDGNFPDYKKAIPDITGITPFRIRLSKAYMNTDALYELYSRKVRINARYVAGLAIEDDLCQVFAGKGAVVFHQVDERLEVEYTAVIAPMAE